MENLSLKSLFIFDPTLKSKVRKPIEDEIQEAKLLYYYPSNEDKVIKRSNLGIIEGTVSFLDAFAKTEEKFILTDMTKSFYIANKLENEKYIGMIINKGNINSSDISLNQNVYTRKAWLKQLLSNFYDTLILYHGLIEEIFFKNKIDLRDDEEKYKNQCEVLNDFIEGYFDNLQTTKLPLQENMLYFPLNEFSHSQLLLSTQRLGEKIPELKYSCLIYRGHLLHNEVPLDSLSIIYNSFYNNLDAFPKFYNFTRPPYKVIQTIFSGENSTEIKPNNSNYRKCFELIGLSNYLVGISRININNYHVFIPEVYFKTTNEKCKFIAFYHNGLVLFLFLNENFNIQNKLNSLIKMERWIKRYFDDELGILENLYNQKVSKMDNVTFSYVNSCNKALKLSSILFNKKFKTIEKDKLDLFINILKLNFPIFHSSLIKIKGFYIYFIATHERKVMIFLPENLNLLQIKSSIDEIKKDLFDYIFLL